MKKKELEGLIKKVERAEKLRENIGVELDKIAEAARDAISKLDEVK